MMAGVVAMASIIEDFDTQPCKKSRKDAGSPVVKTITNYFSPVPKPVEKPFSPPRTNNIMDYFSRKAPSSNEKTSSPDQSKENSRTLQSDGKHTSPGAAVKQPPQKRSRRTSKAARKLVEAETVCSIEEESCLIVEELHDNKDSAAETISSYGILGNDTAALLVQVSAQSSVTAGKSERNGTKTVGEKRYYEDNIDDLSPIVPSKDKAKQIKTFACNSNKKQQQGATHSEPEEKDTESSLCDVSMEVNVDEASQLNSSTVRISFEEFVRSQSQDCSEDPIEAEQGKEDASKLVAEAEEMDTEQLDVPKTEENKGFGEPPVHVSPRTVTIQAEVHVVSPKQEETKTTGKLASIFNRRKGAVSPLEVVSSSQIEAAHQVPSTSLTVKRKSNVVLQEEDLELAVLESESTPKCSEAERKQFMAAFKQPSLDGSKTKLVKSQGKQKQPEEKVLNDTDKAAEDNMVIPNTVEQVSAASQEDKVAKKKPTRKNRNKAKEENETVSAPSVTACEEETVAMAAELDDEREEPPITSTPSIPAVRRSKRESVVRQAPGATLTTPIRKTRRLNESTDGAAALANDSQAKMSTPKIRKSKHGVFISELVCPPDTKQSPIRIKFTRVHKTIPLTTSDSGRDKNTALPAKTSDNSKKRKQAKKLVEKARVIQQSKKAAVEKKSTLRRSSRAEAVTKKSYCEDEDSIICLEEDKTDPALTAPEKSKPQKSLRSLNDVLGKATSAGKEKAVSGSKVASLGPERTTRRVSAVISIFDESSREGSENSQDDEQFRARREFLKSGLPESFRKQIAKTTATKEAYSLSCSFFQPVIHVKQPPNDCPLWSLLWPESSRLCHLKELWCQTSSALPSLSGSLCVKTESSRRALRELRSGWSPEISEGVRQLLLEEISASNPSFPVQTFISRFLKRRIDHQQQCTGSEPEDITRVTSTTFPAVGGKRKRMADELEMIVKVAKKQRATSSEDTSSTPESEPTKRPGRTRRAQRSRQEEQANEKAKPSVKAASTLSEDDCVVVHDDLLEDSRKKDVVKEDVLWTDKYQPQYSSDIVGNSASVRQLHSWLKEWKLRADQEERRKQKDKKQEGDSEWDCGEMDSLDGEDMLCNTVLITGPTGVGKTAAVYACAQELGFKVFEVNASSLRSGRLILSQLKEATQSHQVDSQGVSAHKPTYFNSYGISSSTGSLRPGSSPRKINSPRRVVSSPRKHPQSPRGAKRGGLAPTSLANFFKMGRPTNKGTPNTKTNEQTASSKNIIKATEPGKKEKDLGVKSPTTTTPKERNDEEQSKKTATSLILFEEVDVIFDDDSGFLAAIKTFMTTTKRPVILTTSDPAFSTMFDGNFEEIHFKTPSVLDVSSFLRVLCLAEDMRTDLWDINSLLGLNGCDIRQSLLQLQFWARSGGGRSVTGPLTHTSKNAELKPETAEEAANMSVCALTVPSTLPPYDTGCTESMMGLLNIVPERDIWELLKSESAVEEALCRELLTNSRQRRVDLLYSNMETLLPLPLTQLTTSTYKQVQSVCLSQDYPPVNQKELQSTCLHDMMPSHSTVLRMAESVECSDDGSPVKISNRMRKTKRRQRLPGQDGLNSDSDSEESFQSLCKLQGSPQAKKEAKESLVSDIKKRKILTPEEKLRSPHVFQCLESIADFLDNMSYVDSCLLVHPEGGDSGTLPVSAVVKDGMTDESRVETDSRCCVRDKHFLEIPAAVEALSFHKCRLAVAEAWGKAQQLEGELGKKVAVELSLPVAAHHKGYSFNQCIPCQPQLVQRRSEVMENLMSRGVFGTLGNRPAAALDYMPTLRTICRSEQLKEQGKVKRRFLHYLDAIHLGLEKSTLQYMAEDFP